MSLDPPTPPRAPQGHRSHYCPQVASFAATMLATIPVLLGNEFDVNVGLKKRRRRSAEEEEEGVEFSPAQARRSTKFLPGEIPRE